MTFLLDVNVLIGLTDPEHVHHHIAHAWFAREGARAWATCPMTENALLRILGNPRYPNTPGPPAAVADLLQNLKRLPGHVFWPDQISLTDCPLLIGDRLHTYRAITDIYLLALAVSRDGMFASFDRRLAVDAIRGGARALRLIA